MPNHLQTNLQDPVNPTVESFSVFHDHAMFFVIFIVSLVLYVIVSILFSKATNLNLLYSETVEVIWTILPSLILVFLALPSLKVLYLSDEVINPSFTVKTLGHQWYWSYEYPDFSSLEFDSYMKAHHTPSEFRCLDVDNRVVVPTDASTRMVVSSSDVIHSWAVPSLGTKVDANPGRLNQSLIASNYNGLHYGQCSEVCGPLHSYMPICVETVPMNSFVEWVPNTGYYYYYPAEGFSFHQPRPRGMQQQNYYLNNLNLQERDFMYHFRNPYFNQNFNPNYFYYYEIYDPNFDQSYYQNLYYKVHENYIKYDYRHGYRVGQNFNRLNSNPYNPRGSRYWDFHWKNPHWRGWSGKVRGHR